MSGLYQTAGEIYSPLYPIENFQLLKIFVTEELLHKA